MEDGRRRGERGNSGERKRRGGSKAGEGWGFLIS